MYCRSREREQRSSWFLYVYTPVIARVLCIFRGLRTLGNKKREYIGYHHTPRPFNFKLLILRCGMNHSSSHAVQTLHESRFFFNTIDSFLLVINSTGIASFPLDTLFIPSTSSRTNDLIETRNKFH